MWLKNFLYNASNWDNRKRNTISFFFVFFIVVVLDFLFKKFLPTLFTNYDPQYLDFAPELWVGLIAIVLGTLIIVISIASQSTPKLISFFIGDYLSLLYSWGLIFGLIHSFYASKEPAGDPTQMQSIHLNVLFFLPLGALAAFPYILYILNFTKKSRIIRIVSDLNERTITRLGGFEGKITSTVASKYHRSLFRGLNSLDDLFEYVAFKEPRSEILNSFSQLLTNYIRLKKQLPDALFQTTAEMKKDISFRGLNEELVAIQESRSFYEFKTLHILSDIYLRLIKEDEYQLASQCGKEISDCGKRAIEANEDQSLQMFFTSLNTLLRFSLKHGIRSGEVRNTYNLLFHYSELVIALIEARKTQFLIKQSRHLCYYASEIIRYVPEAPSFIFLIDIVYLEFNKIIECVCHAEMDDDSHMLVLEQYLCIGPSDKLLADHLDLAKQLIRSNSQLKISLALYYIHSDQSIYVDLILTKIRNDLKRAGFTDTKNQLLASCDQIARTDKEFWESTDRGNQNIYYSPYKERLDDLREMILSHPEA